MEWGVLAQILLLFSFSRRFTDLILASISSTKFSILLNGSLYGYFAASRGLRQGDPKSPALFTILSDVLSRMLVDYKQKGQITKIKIA